MFFKVNFRYFGFYIRFESTSVKKQKETLVYPTMSFVSELGGSLGLFIGFSFLTIWDYFDTILHFCQARLLLLFAQKLQTQLNSEKKEQS